MPITVAAVTAEHPRVRSGRTGRRASSLRGLEVEFKSLLEVAQSLFFGLALTGYVDLQALRNVPIPFTPDCRSKRPNHIFIVRQRLN